MPKVTFVLCWEMMRLTVIVVCACLCMMASTVFGANKPTKITPDIEGFNGFKWGTPLYEVMKVYDDLKCVKAELSDRLACGTDALFEAGSYKYKVTYGFKNKRLYLVSLFSAEVKDIYKILQDVHFKYGNPTQKPEYTKEDSRDILTVWDLKGSTITTNHNPEKYIGILLEEKPDALGF